MEGISSVLMLQAVRMLKDLNTMGSGSEDYRNPGIATVLCFIELVLNGIISGSDLK